MSSHINAMNEAGEYIRELEAAGIAVLRAWDDFNNPAIRVGPVFPRMEDLRTALGVRQPAHMDPER